MFFGANHEMASRENLRPFGAPGPTPQARRRNFSVLHPRRPSTLDETVSSPATMHYIDVVASDPDVEAVENQGLLDGPRDSARVERAELVAWLLQQGLSVEQIRAAVSPMLLPASRVVGKLRHPWAGARNQRRPRGRPEAIAAGAARCRVTSTRPVVSVMPFHGNVTGRTPAPEAPN